MISENLKKPKVGLSTILINERGQVLLGKRKGSHGNGTYGFPGGHLEFGETWEGCILRELEEETGLTKENISLIDKIPDAITNDIFEKENKHYNTLYFRAKYRNGDIKVMEPDKCEEWIWCYLTKGILPKNLFKPIENLLEQRYSPTRNIDPIFQKFD